MLTQHNEDGRLNMGAAAAGMWRLFFLGVFLLKIKNRCFCKKTH